MVKVKLFLSMPRRHTGGSRSICALIVNVEVSGHLQTPTALPPGKDPGTH